MYAINSLSQFKIVPAFCNFYLSENYNNNYSFLYAQQIN